MARPRRNPNDPPTVETDTPSPMSMPEQRVMEPPIAPPPTVEVEEPAEKQVNVDRDLTAQEQDWIEICIRVKRTGGFIKGLAKAGQEKATQLMAKYGTKPEEGWKRKPHIPRFDNASHDTNQKKLFEKPVKMIQVQA